MNKKYSLAIHFIILFSPAIAQQSFPKVVSGRIERIENFQSKYVTARNIDIWLPNG